MLSRRECMNAAESLVHGNDIDRRNAARSLADYVRIILNEIGAHYSGYGIIKHSPIKHRYKLLRTLVPQLIPLKKLFFEIQELRDAIEHDDEVIPSNDKLGNLINDVKNLEQLFVEDICPDLEKLDMSLDEKLLEDWTEVFYLYDRLDNYLFLNKNKFNDLVRRVHKYMQIVSRLKELNDQTKINIDRELLKLQIDLRNLFEERT